MGLAGALAGCVAMPSRTPVLEAARRDETWPELEPLLAVRAEVDALVVRVASKGCAARGDFVFRVDRHGGRAVVAIARKRLETCAGPPAAVDLVFPYAELGLHPDERIAVANPLAPPRS